MVSPELLRRYPFFAGLGLDHIVTLAQVADEMTVEAEYYFLREGDRVDHFYLILEGEVAVTITLPGQNREVITSTLGPEEVFGWSALVPPHDATSNVKTLTRCRLVSFDCDELWPSFEADCRFGYLMIQKIAQIIRERLRDMRIETLADVAG
jgi:CRP-like cAMP-binding protein